MIARSTPLSGPKPFQNNGINWNTHRVDEDNRAVGSDRRRRDRQLPSSLACPQTGQEQMAPHSGSTVARALCLAAEASSPAVGSTYAAYGGMYIAVALIWLGIVDGVTLTKWDVSGAAIALAGMTAIALQPATKPWAAKGSGLSRGRAAPRSWYARSPHGSISVRGSLPVSETSHGSARLGHKSKRLSRHARHASR